MPITESDARAIVGWRYDGPHAAYNCPPDAAEETVRLMLDPANAYHAARDEQGELVGYCCFGVDARVPGGDYSDDTVLDAGLGLRPDLTGCGLGHAFVDAIAAFARTQLGHRHLQLTVAAWNRRAIRTFEKTRFRTTHSFSHDTPGGRANASTEWLQMTRDDRPVRFVCTRETYVPARNSQGLEIGWLGPSDYSLALEAWRLRGGVPTREQWELSWPTDGYRFAGIVAEGRLLSIAAALSWKPPSPTSWELGGVWTREAARLQGLGTAVCSFVTAHILASGRLATCNTTRSRPAMIGVVRRLGYQRADE